MWHFRRTRQASASWLRRPGPPRHPYPGSGRSTAPLCARYAPRRPGNSLADRTTACLRSRWGTCNAYHCRCGARHRAAGGGYRAGNGDEGAKGRFDARRGGGCAYSQRRQSHGAPEKADLVLCSFPILAKYNPAGTSLSSRFLAAGARFIPWRALMPES